jgi:glucosamine--fructose-6-phosphate aminotransferase (isomerizing)
MPDSNTMRDQVLAAPAALRAGFDEMERAIRLVLTTPEIYRIRRIVLTGSGDSRFAAKAAELAVLEHAAIPVEVRPPMEAGRYHAQLSADRDLATTLVIALSNSGKAARVCEAAALYRRHGATVLAITRDGASPLAAATGRVVALPIPPLPGGPGFAAYLFQFTALVLIAIRIGEVRMTTIMDRAQALRRTLKAGSDELERVIAAADGPCRALAERLGGKRLLEFVGAGPLFAVSEYGAAKILEAVGQHAVACELEEWTHLNYFDAAPEEIATQITIPRGSRAESRGAELLAYMTRLGRSVSVIGAGPVAEAARRDGHAVVAVDCELAESWSPLLLSAPHALIAAHRAALTGADYGRGGKGRWADSADAGTVQKSAMWEPAR